MENKFQRLLWTIAGAEHDILRKCKTDHKKFSAIGATILMTSFIAFLAGTAAAWYFTQSGESTSGKIGWALLFGLVWSLLIFSIDRSLVITLKKDPTLTRQKFIVPLLSRAALACIIAFMVSIPLELVVFEDFIAGQKYFFNEQAANELSENTNAHKEELNIDNEIDISTKSMGRLDSLNRELNKEVKDFDSQIETEKMKLNNPTTNSYLSAKRRYEQLDATINNEVLLLRSATNHQDSVKYQKSIAGHKNDRAKYKKTMNDEMLKWNNNVNNEIDRLNGERNNVISQITQNNLEYSNESERLSRNRNTKDTLVMEKNRIVNDFSETNKKGNHFIQNFRVLEYAVRKRDANGNLPTEFFFLWMIRLLFFIIEILPTVVKIVTPLGSYDRMVYAEEQELKNYLSSTEYSDRIRSLHDAEMKAKEDQIKQQHDVELELKKDILEKVKEAQKEVAEATIAKWKEDELSRLDSSNSNPVI